MTGMRTVRFSAGLALLVAVGLAGCSASAPQATSTSFSTWNTAVANRATSAARWVAVGDSITEGQGASSRSHRWLTLTLAKLRRHDPTTGVPGGIGYLPAEYAVYGPDSTWGNWVGDATGTDQFVTTIPDLGYRAVGMDAGATRTYSFTGTGLDVWWARYPGSGAFTYSIDNGTPRRVKTDGAASAGTVTEIDGLDAGRHTVTVSAIAAFDLEGFTVFDGDRHKGISLFDSAHSGSTVATFLADEKGYLSAMRRAAPDLVTITLGENDAAHLTPAQLRPQYLKLIRALKALPTKPSILIIGEYQAGPAMTASMSSPWKSYLGVIKGVAKTTNTGYMSLYDSLPVATTSGKGYFSTDGLHPNDKGQRKIAGLVYDELLRNSN